MGDNHIYQSDWSIIRHKDAILRGKLALAVEQSSNKQEVIGDAYLEFMSNKLSVGGLMHDAAVLKKLEEIVHSLRDAGNYDEALAWGEVLYIIRRNPFDAWINLLDIYVEKGVLSYSNLIEVSKTPSSTAIPKKIMQFWDKVPPEGVSELINIWKTEEVDFDHCLIDQDFATKYLIDNFPADYINAFNLAPTAAGKSDIFRLAYLYENGGVYIDADERRFGNLSSLMPEEAEVVVNVSTGPPPCINNWFIGSSVNSSLIGEILSRAVQVTIDNNTMNYELSPWILSGPGLFTMTILDILVENGRNDSRLKGLFLQTEAEYRRVAVEDQRLTYKKDPNMNWKYRYDKHLHNE